MVCITFGNDTEQNILCRSTDEENQFAMNQVFLKTGNAGFMKKLYCLTGILSGLKAG